MRVRGRADFAYGNTRLHARRGELLGRADYDRLLRADVDGILEALATTAYAAEVEATDRHGGLRRLHEIVSAHMSRSLEEMRSFYTERARPVIDILLSRFDVHNLLALLRAHARSEHPAEAGSGAVVDVGWLVEPLTGEILRQSELAGAVDLIARSTPEPGQARVLRAAFAEYERIEDLAALERAIVAEHASRTAATLSTAGPEAGALLRFAGRAIDERNLVVALRRWEAQTAGVDLPPTTPIAGGSIPPAVLQNAMGAATAPALAGRFGEGRWAPPLRRWASTGDLAGLERELDRRCIVDAAALFDRGDPLAIDVPLAFTAATEIEARNLRLLGEASVRGIDPEIVGRELLRPRARP